MKKFDSLLKASVFAATLCENFRFATSDERYDVQGLLILADTSDSVDPIDEDSFYVVSPKGSIGLCHDCKNIDWLFLPDTATDEDLPLTYKDAPQIKFCTQCGSQISPGARFCYKCGIALSS